MENNWIKFNIRMTFCGMDCLWTDACMPAKSLKAISTAVVRLCSAMTSWTATGRCRRWPHRTDCTPTLWPIVCQSAEAFSDRSRSNRFLRDIQSKAFCGIVLSQAERVPSCCPTSLSAIAPKSAIQYWCIFYWIISTCNAQLGNDNFLWGEQGLDLCFCYFL